MVTGAVKPRGLRLASNNLNGLHLSEDRWNPLMSAEPDRGDVVIWNLE
jgi:hypothetical protein